MGLKKVALESFWIQTKKSRKPVEYSQQKYERQVSLNKNFFFTCFNESNVYTFISGIKCFDSRCLSAAYPKTAKTLNTAKTHLAVRMKNFVKMAKVFEKRKKLCKKESFFIIYKKISYYLDNCYKLK